MKSLKYVTSEYDNCLCDDFYVSDDNAITLCHHKRIKDGKLASSIEIEIYDSKITPKMCRELVNKEFSHVDNIKMLYKN